MQYRGWARGLETNTSIYYTLLFLVINFDVYFLKHTVQVKYLSGNAGILLTVNVSVTY